MSNEGRSGKDRSGLFCQRVNCHIDADRIFSDPDGLVQYNNLAEWRYGMYRYGMYRYGMYK